MFSSITLTALLRTACRKDKVESEGQLKDYYNNPGGKKTVASSRILAIQLVLWLDSVILLLRG